MKRIVIPGIILLMALFLAGCSNNQPEAIGVIDMQKILQESSRAVALQKELSDIGDKLQKEYDQKQQELSSTEGKKELDRIYQEYLDNKNRLEEQLNQDIQTAVTSISSEQNLRVVVKKELIYYGGTDITDQVVSRLDQQAEGGAKANGEGK